MPQLTTVIDSITTGDVGLAATGAGVHRTVVARRRDLVEDGEAGLVDRADDGVVRAELVSAKTRKNWLPVVSGAPLLAMAMVPRG